MFIVNFTTSLKLNKIKITFNFFKFEFSNKKFCCLKNNSNKRKMNRSFGPRLASEVNLD